MVGTHGGRPLRGGAKIHITLTFDEEALEEDKVPRDPELLKAELLKKRIGENAKSVHVRYEAT